MRPARAVWRWGVVLCLALLSLAVRNGSADSDSSSDFTILLQDAPAAVLSFSAEPAVTGCVQTESGNERQAWSCTDYSLEVTLRTERGASLISFALRSTSREPFNLHEYSARVAVPYFAGSALWTFNRLAKQNILETDLTRPWEFFSAANRGIPYLALVDSQGLNTVALGLLAQDHIVLSRGELSQDNKDYVLTLRQTDDAVLDLSEGTIYLSFANDLWFHNAQAYTAAVDDSRGYVAPALPAAASDPVYDSWYWTLDRIDQKLVWDVATRSQALGFKTYLLDAGWDTRAGEYAKWLGGSTGDYTPQPGAFPDFPGLLDDIKSKLGMRVMLWMQQYALGRHSIYYPEFGGALCSLDDGSESGLIETPALCPRAPETLQHMNDLFGRILTDYRPDAFWFDWQEDIPERCDAFHFHAYDTFGQGYNAVQQAISDTIRGSSPETFVDMRWPYANLNNKPYIHLWQPIDSSQDYDAMRLRAMVMRPFSAGILTGTDEMYWDPAISDTDAARFMATVVFTGVPYFGPNLLAEPASRGEMLKAWLGFYEANRKDLTEGDFSPYGDRDHPDQFIEGQEATYIYYGSRKARPLILTKATDKIYIVNTSQSASIDLPITGLQSGDYQADISDLLLRNAGNPQVVSLHRSARLRFDVPVGCLLTLTRVQ